MFVFSAVHHIFVFTKTRRIRRAFTNHLLTTQVSERSVAGVVEGGEGCWVSGVVRRVALLLLPCLAVFGQCTAMICSGNQLKVVDIIES